MSVAKVKTFVQLENQMSKIIISAGGAKTFASKKKKCSVYGNCADVSTKSQGIYYLHPYIRSHSTRFHIN